MNIDLITMFGNLSQSLGPVQLLIKYVSLLLGMVFVASSLIKFKKVLVHSAHSSSREHLFTPVMYLLIGAVLIYLPSAIEVVSNTAFGVGNIMAYPTTNQVNVRDSVVLLIRTIGMIWFIRGCVLIAHASEPGNQHGLKGLLFIIAGVFAINYEGSVAMLNWAMQGLIDGTKAVKNRIGY